MIRVGITGGIGAGKSLATKIFEVLGIPIYDADTEAKRLIKEDPQLVQNIKKLLGDKAYAEDGSYDRAYVGSKVFADKSLLSQLNGLVHPAVHHDLQTWFSNQQSPYAIEEAALIIESAGHKHMDVVILVTCPKALRVERVMKRNNITEAEVLKRMDAQLSDNEKRKHCHFEIINDEQHFLIPQILHIHNTLINNF